MSVGLEPSPAEEQMEERGRAAVINFPRRRFVIRKAVLGAAAAAALTALPIIASGSALPNSALYGLKLRIERVQLAFTHGAVARGFKEIGFAQERLEEAEQLTRIGLDYAVPPTLRLMQRELQHGTQLILSVTNSEEILALLASKLRETSGGLDGLLDLVPAEIRPAILEAIASGRELSQQVAVALGIAAQAPVAGAIAAPAGPAGAPAVDPASIDSPRVIRDPGYTTTTSPRGGATKGQKTDNDAQYAPCIATVYAGPSSGHVHGACGAINNEQGSGTSQINPPVLPGRKAPGGVQPPQDQPSPSGPQPPVPSQSEIDQTASTSGAPAPSTQEATSTVEQAPQSSSGDTVALPDADADADTTTDKDSKKGGLGKGNGAVSKTKGKAKNG